MKQKGIALNVLVILLLLAATAAAVSPWQQVNSNGFGDVQADAVSAVEPFNGHLYASTSNAINGARIFRSSDGMTWTAVIDPGFGNPHDTAPPAILDMMVFNGRLYASTGKGNAAQIWRTLDGINWASVVNAGFGDLDIVDITNLAEYGGLIYAGASHSVEGAQIWRSFTGDSNSWTQVAPTTAGTTPASITGFAIFDGALYTAVELEDGSPAQIWRSYGGEWTAVMTNGFGSSTTLTGGMTEFLGYLYVGAGNTVDGAQLWRTGDGAGWAQVAVPAFGDPNNLKVELVYTFQNHLYIGIENAQTGLELWRSVDGLDWEQANLDGFGDSHNASTNQSNAAANFLNQLYMGTVNAIDGGELWQMQQPFAVTLSPDDARDGIAGQTITYTLWITNTGTATDTYSLGVTGNNWLTLPTPPAIALSSGASTTFTVAVSIPTNATGGAVDAVTLTAVSQSNGSIKDSVLLTTQCLDLSQKLYLPILLLSPAPN